MGKSYKNQCKLAETLGFTWLKCNANRISHSFHAIVTHATQGNCYDRLIYSQPEEAIMSEEHKTPEAATEAKYPGVFSKVGHTIAEGVVGGIKSAAIGAVGGAVAGAVIDNIVVSPLISEASAKLVSDPDIADQVVSKLSENTKELMEQITTQQNISTSEALVKSLEAAQNAIHTALPVGGAAVGALTGAAGGTAVGTIGGAIGSFTEKKAKPVVGDGKFTGMLAEKAASPDLGNQRG
jgi:hypothetical protein